MTGRWRAVLRWTARVVAVFSVVAAGLILVACIVDDARIDADRATATATVTEVTARRAAIEFDTDSGRHVRPKTGVFYPTGLEEGQRIRVDYRRANPDLVRVSGRSWTVGLWPALSVPLVTVPLCVLVEALTAGRPRRWFAHSSPRRGRIVVRSSPVRRADGAV